MLGLEFMSITKNLFNLREMDTIAYNTTNIYRRNAIRAKQNDVSCESWYILFNCNL